MNLEQLTDIKLKQQLKAVNFVESGHGPMVIEVEYENSDGIQRSLIKDNQGKVATYQHLKAGYELCLKAGIHEANLVQVETHDEACQSDYADYHRELIPLVF